jgi:hypothetical protein
MGWLIALGILTALAILPLGVSAQYDSGGTLVRLILGPVKLILYPRPHSPPKKEKKPKEKKQEEKTSEKETQEASAPVKKKEASGDPQGGDWKDFLPLFRVAMEFLGNFRRKLRVRDLEMKLILAGDDPCDLAVNYGRAWAALGNLMPKLERFLVIRKRNLEVECDFTSEKTLVFVRLELTITLGRLLGLAVVYGIRGLREYLKISKKRKGGAVQ